MRAYFRPLCGVQVRRAMALWTLTVGVPRLPWPWVDLPFAPLRFVPPEVYGVVMTALGIALYVTAYHGRLSLAGRLAAVCGFTMWMVLAAATTSTTSMLADLVVASVLLTEVWVQRGRCSDGD